MLGTLIGEWLFLQLEVNFLIQFDFAQRIIEGEECFEFFKYLLISVNNESDGNIKARQQDKDIINFMLNTQTNLNFPEDKIIR